MRTLTLPAALAALASIALACSPSPGTGDTGAATPPDVAARGAATPDTQRAPAGSTPAERAPAPADPGALRACGDALRVTRLTMDAGAGQRGVTYALTNTGSSRCAVRGYPELALRDSAGAPLAGVSVVRDADAAADSSVTLAPGARATFGIHFTGIPADGKPCARSASIAVTPPGATRATVLPARLEVCASRQVHLRPVVAGRG